MDNPARSGETLPVMRRLRRTLLSAACFLLSGCAYFENRARDLLDVVHVDVAGGAGLGLHARASVVHTGFGYGQMYRMGLLPRPWGKHATVGIRPEFHSDFLIHQRAGVMSGTPNAFYDDPLAFTWLSRKDETEDLHHCWFLHLPDHAPALPRGRAWELLDVSVTANAGLVGARLGASPGQWFDFLLGWFGLDIAGDDR